MFKDTIATYKNEIAAAKDTDDRFDAQASLFAGCAETVLIEAQEMVDAGKKSSEVGDAAHALMLQAAKELAAAIPDSGSISSAARENGLLWHLYDALHNETQYFDADYDGAVQVDWSVHLGDTPANSRLMFKAA